MSAEPESPRVAPESGRPAASDDPVTRRATVPPGRISEDAASEASTPEGASRPLLDAEASEEEREATEALREMGWSGAPFVTHRGELVVESDLYDAAEQLGLSDCIPRIELREVFREAGYDLDEVGQGYGPERDPAEVLAEDFLRELPRHVRDKYGI